MLEPERPLEPKEPTVWGYCEDCGEAICIGDEFYATPENELADVLCEDCALRWLNRHRRVARED